VTDSAAAAARWVDTAAGLDEVVGELTGQPVIGLDTEFHRERSYYPHVALVQLAWPGQVALLDAIALDLSDLAPVLRSDATFVMHAAAQDIEALDRACGETPARLFDTQLAAGFIGYGSPSLAALVEGELGVRLVKGDRLTDWLARPLSDDVRAYAASDVVHLLELHTRLVDRLERRGRLTWALDECANLLEAAKRPREPDEAWWRVREARQLRGPAVGVAQSVAAWRERRAATVDQPVRFVLPDMALLAIAQRPPKGLDQLRRVRGLDERHLRGGGAEELLDAVHAGLAMPRSEQRLPRAGDVERHLRPAVALASAWLSQLGRELRIDTALLGTRGDLEALIRGDADARLATGWRGEVVGAPVRRLLDGEAALAFDGKGGLVLEERSGRRISHRATTEG
jgi:ribonuclease D